MWIPLGLLPVVVVVRWGEEARTDTEEEVVGSSTRIEEVEGGYRNGFVVDHSGSGEVVVVPRGDS